MVMRVSVPTIPHATGLPFPRIPVNEAIARVAAFIRFGNVTVITGAGVSVDSGIKAYRGADGRYMNPDYKPIFYHELIDTSPKGHSFRQRYWLRSYLGYPPLLAAKPNTTHVGIAALQYSGHITRLITQNVDGLHLKALSTVESDTGLHSKRGKLGAQVVELHGSLHTVHCSHHHAVDRTEFQQRLGATNPRWRTYAAELEASGQKPQTNPDGDVVLQNVSYDDFVIPKCLMCAAEGRQNDVHKPQVTFFGESISAAVRDRSFADVEQADRILIIGTTLATYSAFRLLKHAITLHKPVLMINVGPTRADKLFRRDESPDVQGLLTPPVPANNVEKLEVASGDIIMDVVSTVLGVRGMNSPDISRLLKSAINVPSSLKD